jgi:hypothetical protein
VARRDVLHLRVRQAMVGITEYASTHAGFRGTLKYRYSVCPPPRR